MRRGRIGLALGLAACGLALQTLAPTVIGCATCQFGGSTARDVIVGCAFLAALVWVLTWLESAPWRDVAVHSGGLAAAIYFVWSLGPYIGL